MNLIATNPQTGEQYELQGNEWVPVNREEIAGRMAAQGMGAGESFLVGAGHELSSMGAGIRNLLAGARGDTRTQQRIAEEQAAQEGYMSGTSEQLGGLSKAGLLLGHAAPYLATMPLGVGATGVRGLASSMAIGAALGGAKYSGDQGTDAILGALLSGAGYGLGSLAGRTVSMIRGNGAAARAAMMDLGEASLGGKAIRFAQKAAGALPEQSPAELAAEVLKTAVLHGRPELAALKGAKGAALALLRNREVADALVRFAGAGEGGLGHVGAQFGYSAPGLM